MAMKFGIIMLYRGNVQSINKGTAQAPTFVTRLCISNPLLPLKGWRSPSM